MDARSNETDAEHSVHHHEASGASGAPRHGGHSHKSPALCGGEWKYPVTCDPMSADCSYHAKWEYLEPSDQVRFTLAGKYTPNHWIAIGFSNSPQMVSAGALLRLAFKNRSGQEFNERLLRAATNGRGARLGGA